MDLTDTLDPTAHETAAADDPTTVGGGYDDNTEINGMIHKEENKFQTAIASWRNIDLTALRPNLDTAASDLVAHQRDSLVQRKDLAQKTKDFRKLDDTSKLNEVKGLLKAYQTYIDLITNQSKAIHNAFLSVYTPLSEAPDPYPLLEASIDSLVTAEEILPKVAEENHHLQKSVNKLTSQLEATETRLEHERSVRQELESSRDEKIKAVEESWEAVLSEKQNNWEAKEKALDEKIENQDRLLKELKASYEVSQRLGKGENDEHYLQGATAAELEIVTSELDRANMRLAEVEARNEQLRLELAQSASSTSSSRPTTTVEEDPAFLRLQSENSSLLRRLDNARFEKDAEKRKAAGNLRSLEREVSTLKSDREALRHKLQQWGDYEDLKRELEVLKSIEFATGDDDDLERDADTAAPDAGVDSTSKKESLEQLLLARNKKLNSELTLLRVSHHDLQTRLETLQEELSTTNMELEKSRNLATTLENDLERVQNEAVNAFPSNASVAGTYTSRYPHSSLRRGGRAASPTSSIISGFDPQSDSPARSSEGAVYGGGSGMLPMITAQRDRYKKKNADLESQLQKSNSTVQSLRSEIASLQKDNLNLYEKTRYVSTYARGSHATASSASAYSATAPAHTAIAIDDGVESSSGGGLDQRYRPAYEANLSPFAAFRSRESSRAFRRMAFPERVVFQITKMVLATRTSRNLFAAYCLGLHLLVLGMLYYMGSASTAGRIVTASAGAANAASGVGNVVAGQVGGGGGAAGGPKVAAEWHREGFQEGG